jgi:hypothetical protein
MKNLKYIYKCHHKMLSKLRFPSKHITNRLFSSITLGPCKDNVDYIPNSCSPELWSDEQYYNYSQTMRREQLYSWLDPNNRPRFDDQDISDFTKLLQEEKNKYEKYNSNVSSLLEDHRENQDSIDRIEQTYKKTLTEIDYDTFMTDRNKKHDQIQYDMLKVEKDMILCSKNMEKINKIINMEDLQLKYNKIQDDLAKVKKEMAHREKILNTV